MKKISRIFGSQEVTSLATVFIQSDAVAIILFAACFVRLLYEFISLETPQTSTTAE